MKKLLLSGQTEPENLRCFLLSLCSAGPGSARNQDRGQGRWSATFPCLRRICLQNGPWRLPRQAHGGWGCRMYWIFLKEQKDKINERLRLQRKNKKRICPQCEIRELDKWQRICSECGVINRQITVDIYSISDKYKKSQAKYNSKPENKERNRLSQKKWRETNKEKIRSRERARKAKYNQDNKEKICKYNRERYYRLKNEKNSNAADWRKIKI